MPMGMNQAIDSYLLSKSIRHSTAQPVQQSTNQSLGHISGNGKLCPDCLKYGVQTYMHPGEGCAICPVCGYSPCK